MLLFNPQTGIAKVFLRTNMSKEYDLKTIDKPVMQNLFNFAVTANFDLVKYIVENKSDQIDIKGGPHVSIIPLMQTNDVKVADYLIQHGASPCVENDKGTTPFQHAYMAEYDRLALFYVNESLRHGCFAFTSIKRNPKMIATNNAIRHVRENYVKEVSLLLIRKKVDVMLTETISEFLFIKLK